MSVGLNKCLVSGYNNVREQALKVVANLSEKIESETIAKFFADNILQMTAFDELAKQKKKINFKKTNNDQRTENTEVIRVASEQQMDVMVSSPAMSLEDTGSSKTTRKHALSIVNNLIRNSPGFTEYLVASPQLLKNLVSTIPGETLPAVSADE